MAANQRSRTMQIARLGGVMTKARNIWIDHPMLKQITTFVVDHLDGITLQGKSRLLVVDAVAAAVLAHDAVESCQRFDADSSEPFFAYMKSLLATASDVGCWVFRCADVEWQPFDVPWLTFSSSGEVVVQPATDRKCASRLYKQLATEFGAPISDECEDGVAETPNFAEGLVCRF